MLKFISLLGSLALINLFFTQCATTTATTKQQRIPTQDTNVPRYQTNDELIKQIAALEKKLQKSPDDIQLLLRIASLSQDVKDYDKALVHMERLKELNYTEDPRLYGSLATIYKSKEDFISAKENYKIFRSLLPPTSSTVAKVDREIEELDFIIQTLASPYEINVQALDPIINTNNSEYLPQFTMDGSSFIFTRRFFNQEDLFLASRSEDGYTTEAIEEVNTLLNEGAHTLSADGTLLIFTHCDKKKGFGSCDLYSSKRLENGKWSNPSNMGKIINTRHWDAQPSLSADGSILYFSSKRDGGLGGSDIWRSQKNKEGRWSKPTNLGTSINTPANDEAPFIHADGQTLYFRSLGHPSLGGYDLYRSIKESDSWSKVTHLGSPINTTGEDGALVVSLDGTKGYYATDQYNGKELGHLDLFSFDLPMDFRPSPMTFVRGRVTDESSGIPIRAEVTVAYLDDTEHTSIYRANVNGEFLAAIPVGRPTLLNIAAQEYAFYSDHIYYEDVKYSIEPYELNVSLTKIQPVTSGPEKTAPIVLKNIFFASGSAQLLPTSNNELALLQQLLQDRPSIKIEIIGHTDDVGSNMDNLKLSQDRADAVRTDLISRGIDGSRMTAIGRGEESPIDTNDTDEGRSNNRRTEFVIIN